MEKQTTKLCKHCKTEIPADAKVCPNCRKKQGGKLKFIIIAVVVIIILAAMFGGNSDDEPKKVDTKSNTSAVSENDTDTDEEIIFKLNETAEMNDVQVTLTDYEESNGSTYYKPDTGNVFLIAEFEIVNNSDEDLAISSLLSFDAYADDYALDYSLSAMAAKEGSQLDGTIAAGKKMKGKIGYEVPEDWNSVEIYFTDSIWDSDKFKFVIEK